MTDRQDDSGAHVATLREWLAVEPLHNTEARAALDAAIAALSPQGSEPAGVGDVLFWRSPDGKRTLSDVDVRFAGVDTTKWTPIGLAAPAPEQQAVTDGLTATEALFGFMGWLTSREPAVTFGAKHEASTAVELISQFMQANGLPDCREDWTTRLTHPVTPDNTTAQGASK